ncbi:MAG: ABC transporter ATP-binding protein/permease, partial [Rhodospirillales bacterium]|nr:ABC transporter ATP-binding protein/permease [Rhodospirillales bacterium]
MRAKRSPIRDYWRLGKGYFSADQVWLRRSVVVALLLMSILQVYIQVQVNLWNADFFNALERKATSEFLRQGALFLGWLTLCVVVSMAQLHLRMNLQVGWRRWMTRKVLKRWVDSGRHYQLGFLKGDHDNPDQRIAEDIRVATETAVDFSLGIFDNLLLLLSFIGILWALSGALVVPVAGMEIGIPGYMVWAALLYAFVGSFAAWLIGRPMVAINYDRREREAEFRFRLVHVRESSEGIALLRGEADERHDLDHALKDVVRVWRRLINSLRTMTGLSVGYNMLATVFPIVVASPQYLSGRIALGGLMQIAGAFAQVQAALSYFVNNVSRYSEWAASVERVVGLMEALDRVDAEAGRAGPDTVVHAASDDGALRLRDVDLAYPDGAVVVQGANFAVAPGEKVLIKGDSGSGKSTLIRALAGLWPWGAGRVEIPRDAEFMFLPQRAYMPLGSLRMALTYPSAEDSFDDAALTEALARCGLAALAPRLGDVDRWENVLSAGEQQRVAFARVLLHKPGWIVMDEALVALDGDARAEIMAVLAADLPGSTIISITHGPGLEPFHDR